MTHTQNRGMLDTSTVILLGQMSAVGIAGLLIAALANAHDVTLLHYDADFEIAAEVLARLGPPQAGGRRLK